ncbi:MAG: DUF1080 domain-containing protein [Planctomycetaceae bacterium]|nr:DUF1080 domain-containing protein [Planctomycetaceae bacterium]
MVKFTSLSRNVLTGILLTSSPLFADGPKLRRPVAPQEIRLTAAKLETEDGSPVIVQGVPNFPAPQDQFLSLMPQNGLDGWTIQEGRTGTWVNEDGEIRCIALGGGWLRTDKEYSDFVLRFEYQLQPGGNTGIGLRCPSVGNPTFTGIEIQLLDDGASKYAQLREDQYTGSIYYQVAAQRRATLRPPGDWNACEIRCIGDQLRVEINGEVVNEVNLATVSQKEGEPQSESPLANRPPVGHIALQSHSTQVRFRKVEVLDLAIETSSGLRYVDLASGQGEPVPGEVAGTVTVHYVGQLLDGKRFSDSRELGPPVTVGLKDAILGWEEGLRGMRPGGRRRLIVPPSLAYGSEGYEKLIPPDATLVFEVELVSFAPASGVVD